MAKYVVGDTVLLKPHQEIPMFDVHSCFFKALYEQYENMRLIISKIDNYNYYYFENGVIVVPERYIADILKQDENSDTEITDGELSDLLFSQI